MAGSRVQPDSPTPQQGESEWKARRGTAPLGTAWQTLGVGQRQSDPATIRKAESKNTALARLAQTLPKNRG